MFASAMSAVAILPSTIFELLTASAASLARVTLASRIFAVVMAMSAVAILQRCQAIVPSTILELVNCVSGEFGEGDIGVEDLSLW
jgi:hypothetical protein